MHPAPCTPHLAPCTLLSAPYASQLTMICTWLSEIYLHAIDAARGAGAESEAAVALEFRAFLTDRRQHLNRGTAAA